MYDLHRLRILRELSVRGTLAAVAEALGYSPSAISHQLSLLERETRTTLLEPAGRGVRLTPAAQALVGHAEAVLAELERAEATIAAHHVEVTGTIRIATFQTAAHRLLPIVLRRLGEEFPRLIVSFAHIPAETAISGLLARDYDLALCEHYPGERPLRQDGVEVRALMNDPLLLVTPRDWGAPVLSEVAGRPWVLEPAGTSAHAWALRACHDAGFAPRVAFETIDLFLQTRLVADGLAAGLLPGLCLDRTTGVHLAPTGAHRTVSIVTRAGGGRSPALRATVQTIADVAGEVEDNVRYGDR